ncbi:MAG TPA: hypothetical protein PKK23_17730, partial [Nitrospirales bacterium]|nr:hypothetical protein [Nitrospirales bacterium]
GRQCRPRHRRGVGLGRIPEAEALVLLDRGARQGMTDRLFAGRVRLPLLLKASQAASLSA